MKLVIQVIAAAIFLNMATAKETTADRIASHNYPVETHKIQTFDNYMLTVFRIPYSPKLQNQGQHRPIVYIQHGFGSISDQFILNGPDNAIAYLCADAGYDVWLGNARGSNYSRENIYISADEPRFWDFSWHEIAIYDLPAIIDYSLAITGETTMHYVGHSQGTTVFFALMATMPIYNAKIKTAHMLAPVVFMKNAKSALFKVLEPTLDNSTALTDLIGCDEIAPSQKFMDMLGFKECLETSSYPETCSSPTFIAGGINFDHLNISLLPDIIATNPASSSIRQMIHFTQGYRSGQFRQYDYGKIGNLLNYRRFLPPDYKLSNIVAPTYLYYSDGDYFADVRDVKKLVRKLPNVKESFHVPYSTWTHFDFLWGREVKEIIYDRILRTANDYEAAHGCVL